MTPRLWMMREMLKPGGVLAICIDHRELFRLGAVLDEMFGEDNRIGIVNWQKSYAPRNDQSQLSTATEYVLVYAKNATRSKTGLLPRTEAMDSRYLTRDGDPHPWKPGDLTARGETTHPTMIYAIQSPFTGQLHYPTAGRHWGSEKKRMKGYLEAWGSEYAEKDIGDGKRPALLIKGAPIPGEASFKPGNKVLAAARKTAEEIRKGVWPVAHWRDDGQGTFGITFTPPSRPTPGRGSSSTRSRTRSWNTSGSTRGPMPTTTRKRPMLELKVFQSEAARLISERYAFFANHPDRPRKGKKARPFFQALSALTGAGKTPILAQAVALLRAHFGVEPIVLWMSKAKPVVAQTLINFSSGGKYSDIVDGFNVVGIQDLHPNLISDGSTPLLVMTTTGLFNNKDQSEGALNIYKKDNDLFGDQSPWDRLIQRDAAGARRPMLVVYDEGHNLSPQQTELLSELEPDAYLLASATLKLPDNFQKSVIQPIRLWVAECENPKSFANLQAVDEEGAPEAQPPPL